MFKETALGEKRINANTSKKINKLTENYLAIENTNAKEADTITYMARSLVIATLPHSKPKGHVFQRTNGDFTLTMIGNPILGLPYGSIPRLLLPWLTSEAKNKNSPVLQLGKSFSDFTKKMNLSKNGGKRGDATRLREQMLRLFSTHVSCTYRSDRKGFCSVDQFSIARSFKLWWKPIEGDGAKFAPQSTITLTDDFYREITDRPVPIDFRMLQALRRSPLQMDIYVWLTYRFYNLKKPTLISWKLLRDQFGANYAMTDQGLRDFKREFLKALHIVKVMYPTADAQTEDEGVILQPSPTHISPKKMRGQMA